jgi:hypothetical protein
MYRRDAPVHSDVNWRLLTCWKWLESTWVEQLGKVKANCRDAKDDKLQPAVISMKKKWRQELTRRRLRGGTEGQKERWERKNRTRERVRARKREWERGRDDDDAKWREKFSTTEMGTSKKQSNRGSAQDVSHPRSHHFPSHNLSLESRGRLSGLAG